MPLIIFVLLLINGCTVVGLVAGEKVDKELNSDKYAAQYAEEGFEIDKEIIKIMLSVKDKKTSPKIPCNENPKCHIYRNGEWIK